MSSDRYNGPRSLYQLFRNLSPMKFRTLPLLLSLAGLSNSLSGAIQIDGFATLANDRYANDAQFIADQFDLSGVGINSQSSQRWATMVSKNVYITADHFAPGVGSTVTFYETNDPNGAFTTRSITADREQIGATDLFVGTLNAPLGDDFSFYDFATEDIPDFSSFLNSSYAGANAYLVGRSPTNTFPKDQQFAVGRNRLDAWFGEVDNTGGSTGNIGDAIGSVVQGSGDTGFVPSEAFLQPGDSGAPLFVDSGMGDLTIVGINWFTSNTEADGSGDDLNGQTYVGNYDLEIQAFIDANPVPEPGTTGALLALGIVAYTLAIRRRRLGL